MTTKIDAEHESYQAVDEESPPGPGRGRSPFTATTQVAPDLRSPFMQAAPDREISRAPWDDERGARWARELASDAVAGLSSTTRLSVRVASGEPLSVREFVVEERMNALFAVQVVAVVADPSLDFEAAVGMPASFAAVSRIAPSRPRLWSGVCSHLRQVRVEPTGLSTYEIEIVPQLWLLDQRRNYRMFQQRSELEIALALLAEWGIEPELRVTSTYRKRKYRVQYGESDYAFFCRMLEDAGVAFFFEQGEAGTTLVLADAPQAAAPRAPHIAFRDRATAAEREHVTEVAVGRRVRPGRYTVRDHDYRRAPSYKLLATARDGRGVEDRLERYHYVPGAFLFESERGEETPFADDRGRYRTDEGEADKLAQRRLEAQRTTALLCSFATNALDLSPGVVVGFLDHPHARLADDKRHLVVASSLRGAVDREWTHRCEAVSAEVPYRPPLATPKPRVNGVESATVVGAPGEEIHTDEFGRVRVHFHWDRESAMNDQSSCWIHVSQSWGGAGFGGLNLPRVGQEVIVDFIGGDPDRPIVVGRVYTNVQKVPYKLPDAKTQSGWKSASTHGTGGYNEISFEDSATQELFHMQAEKDMSKLVKHDEKGTVGRDRTRSVGRDEASKVGNDRRREVGHDERLGVGNDRHRQVGNDEQIGVGHDRRLQVGHDQRISVGNDQREVIGRDQYLDVGRDHHEKVVNDQSLTVGNDRMHGVVRDDHLDVGRDAFHAVGQNLRQDVVMNTTFVGGQNRTAQVGLVDSVAAGVRFEVAIAPASGGSSANVTMTDQKIVFTTGAGATITMEGSTIRLEATTIMTVAQDFAGLASLNKTVVGGMNQLELGSGGGQLTLHSAKDLTATVGGNASVGATGDATVAGATAGLASTSKTTVASSGGDVVINGGPWVKINS